MKLFFKYLSMHLKVAMEYKTSFIMIMLAQGLNVLIELFTTYALFAKFSFLDDYSIYYLLLSFSIVWLTFSISEMFVRGFDEFSELIIHGNFDILLIRPRNIYLQILGSNIAYEKLSRILISLLLFIYSSIKVFNTFSLIIILELLLMVICGIILCSSIFIIGASFCFISIQGIEFINIFTNGTRQLGQFPMQIYPKAIRFIFTFIIPLTLINYFPIEYLLNHNNIIYAISPLFVIIFLLFSIFLFNQGIKKYSSVGS